MNKILLSLIIISTSLVCHASEDSILPYNTSIAFLKTKIEVNRSIIEDELNPMMLEAEKCSQQCSHELNNFKAVLSELKDLLASQPSTKESLQYSIYEYEQNLKELDQQVQSFINTKQKLELEISESTRELTELEKITKV